MPTLKRRTFLKTVATGSAALAAAPLWGAEQENAPASDEDILSGAKDRIEKHRRGDGMIVVRRANGKPVADAKVSVEQTRHEFLFGCNCFMFDRVRDPEREAQYRQRFAALFNFATLGFYWPYYEPERGAPIYDYTDKVLDWCGRHSVRCKGHPLVWDFADPRWLPRDFAEIRALSNARVRDIVSRFKGRLEIWDVVNEPTHLGRFNTRLGEWALSLGAVPYVTEHLKIARAANPQATLLVNDYRTDPPFSKILDALREGGKLRFDAIGIQSHMHGGLWPLRQVQAVCDTYQKFGVPLHFTETTVVSGPRLGAGERWGPTAPELETKQAEAAVKFYTALFAHPAVHALTWWDFSDQGAWQGAAAGFLRKDMSPKPVYDRLMGLVKGEWWTKTQGRTNQKGECAVRAFYGTHRVTAELPNGKATTQEVRWERGQPNRVEVIAG